ncbi:class I SAM-dependent methyltransferase [Saccharopolyspora spinosa]|uniref:dTDP-4-amino-2,3,4,6-tetradeoxy-D-glucose N,N-dimethyltransferase n=1 Tax=Saccharopolyspora spinosa TaxID=60894 RepID=SPNS_SACSN|nr:RecName: Full=dTDP-4-amino-2,3,4,6-tetradeoxy-D-glucose N,N-dimethyltransferase [Saccharopolyspora spinosa]AAG23280.1 probable N-dimethyltransferase [Saccharopolyspora spinosa]
MSRVSDTFAETSSVYSPDHADIYDAIHSARGRDWAAEAGEVVQLVRTRLPEAQSLLDVACGTGAHLERFRAEYAKVAGLELSDAMREIAIRRVPEVPIHIGDIRDFDLGEPFDVITCLCFTAAYMRTVDDLRRVTRNMARHLAPGGVAVIEPWWFPDKFIDGFVTGAVAHHGERVISRLSHSVLEGRTSRMTVRYTVAEPTGIRDFTEFEILSLFTEDEYTAALEDAGIRAEYLPGAPNGRGLFVGIRN